MQINGTLRVNARTYLTHLFGQGLDDQRYVVEGYQFDCEGQILGRPASALCPLGPPDPEHVVLKGVHLLDRGFVPPAGGTRRSSLQRRFPAIVAFHSTSHLSRRQGLRSGVLSGLAREVGDTEKSCSRHLRDTFAW